jgi:putative ABC transport system ATP-binding protein
LSAEPRPEPQTREVAHPLVIETRALSRVYGRGSVAVRAVDRVDLQVRAGEVVLVFGPSGCGKSTLLGLLGGLDREYTGGLTLFGADASRLGDAELSLLRGQRIGFIFQGFYLLPHLNVLANVSAPSLFSGAASPAEARERALLVLERVGLADRAAAHPVELSGGQRQRVAIARALLHEPALLLCDEPTGNLDRDTGAQIIDLFATLHSELGTTIVVVTHEDRLAKLPHRKLFMLDGQLRDSEEPP